jgi:ABC-type transport system involved in multi-copper enzyme maturation permease subunit
MRNVWIIAKRELAAYFGTGLAYVFAVIFVALTGAFAFSSATSSSAAKRISLPSSNTIPGSICCSCRR